MIRHQLTNNKYDGKNKKNSVYIDLCSTILYYFYESNDSLIKTSK